MKILQVNVTTSIGNDDTDLVKNNMQCKALSSDEILLLDIQLFDQFFAQHHTQRFEDDTVRLNQ